MATTYTVRVGDEEFDIEGPDDATEDQLREAALAHLEAPKMVKAKTKGPDGKELFFDVPEGADDATVQDLARKATGDPRTRTIERPGEPQPDDSALNGFMYGVRDVGDNLGRFLDASPLGGIDDAAANFGHELGLRGPAEDGDAVRAQHKEELANNTRTGFQLAGQVAATLPAAFATKSPVIGGALGGAMVSDEETLGGVAKDAAIGAAAGKVGDVALRGVARAVAPSVSDDAALLIKEGVSLTPGQAARTGTKVGRALARQEDKMTSHPFVGDMIDAGRRKSIDTFGTATINRSLAPIGEKLPEGMGAGRRAVRWAGDKLGAAYDDLLPQIRPFQGDVQFMDDLQAVRDAAGDMLPERARQLDKILLGLGRYFDGGTTLDGKALKEIEIRLSANVRKFSTSQDADQQQLGEALDMARSAIRELAARNNPEMAADLAAINKGWASLVQVERAALNSKGVVTPNGYSQAVRAGESTTRRRGYARGQSLNQDLSDAGSSVLPSEIADSGTAGRAASANMIYLGMGALEALPYAAARALANRGQPSQTAEALGLALRRASPYAAAGSPAIIEALRNAGQ